MRRSNYMDSSHCAEHHLSGLRRNQGLDLPAEFDEEVRASEVEPHGLEADVVRQANRAMIRAPLEPLDYQGIDNRKRSFK